MLGAPSSLRWGRLVLRVLQLLPCRRVISPRRLAMELERGYSLNDRGVHDPNVHLSLGYSKPEWPVAIDRVRAAELRLAVQFNNLRLPFVVFLAAPFCVAGIGYALWLGVLSARRGDTQVTLHRLDRPAKASRRRSPISSINSRNS